MQDPPKLSGKKRSKKLTFDYKNLTIWYRKYQLIIKWKKKLEEDPSYFWDIEWDHIQMKVHFRRFSRHGFKVMFEHEGKTRLIVFNRPYQNDTKI